MVSNIEKLAPSLQHALEVWRVRSAGSKERARDPVTVSVTYTGDLAELQRAGLSTGYDAGGEVTGQIAFQDLEQLAAVPGVVHVEMQPISRPELDDSVKEARVPWKVPPGFAGKGRNVIVAVIDTGIDIFHESFKSSGGQTRILELWDQTQGVTGGSAPPAAFAQIGRVYNATQINAGLAAGPPFASVDTDGHGTHVAGTAAGNGSQDDRCSKPGRYVGVAPEADLVIVKAIGVTGSNTRDALQWCAQAGARHAQSGVNKPVVINCSWGDKLGAHDGNDFNDVSVDRILRPAGGPPQGLAVVCSASNEGEGNTHEAGTLQPTGQAGATTTVSFYMPENSLQPDPIAIWYDGVGSISVTLTAPESTAFPGTRTAGPFAPGAANQSLPIGAMTITTTSAAAGSAAHGNQKEINISISTTNGQRMRDGVWTLTLTNTAAAVANYNIWFQPSHSDGYPTFQLPGDSGDAPARRRNNTIGSPGMCRNTITVANYSGNEIEASSSRGPTAFPPGTPSGEVKPTIAAVGSAITAPRSRNDPDEPSSCCDQKVVDKTGTSMAAPHVAGIVAIIFEKNFRLTFEQVRGHLQHSARQDGIPAGEAPVIIDPLPGIPWSNIWGAGKVNAQVALAEIPAAGSAGGGGGGTITLDEESWGYTPHTIFSRLGDWNRRFGPRPGLMLVASLVSEHVDEILRLIRRNKRVGAVWKRNGGPVVVRHLLHATREPTTILPERVKGHDVRSLIPRFLPILSRFGSARLKADIERFGAFVELWPGADLVALDEQALLVAGTP